MRGPCSRSLDVLITPWWWPWWPYFWPTTTFVRERRPFPLSFDILYISFQVVDLHWSPVPWSMFLTGLYWSVQCRPWIFFAPYSSGFCCRYYLLIFIISPLATMCGSEYPFWSSISIPVLGHGPYILKSHTSYVLLNQENSESRSNLEAMIW